ncbi:MAG TPA: SMP-30/gluconolactonase/LRE family protein [Vicinamibacterales bacterium]|nr:SMP-30/gluconolactonase/LRE family protein [Vicinamibacterales bacterium]
MKRSLLALLIVSSALVSSHPLVAQAPDCSPAAGLRFICGLQNPEDVVVVPRTNWLLASGMASGAGLTLVDTQSKTVRKLYAPGSGAARHDRARFGNCPGPLDPKQAVLHGLALRPAGGAYTVYATNHGGRESVEVFELTVGPAGSTAPSATWVGCVLLPPKLAANSVAAFTDGTLVATVLILPGKTFEDAFAMRNTGIVLQWTPGTPAFVELKGTELVANNGIDTSPDDREFYVASTTMRRVYAFSRAKPGGGPLRFAQLKDFGPDNVRWTADNRLITAGLIDDEPACGGRPKNEEGIRCPMGYAVATIDPKSMTATEIARGPRTPSFTGTAMAAVVNNELWLGSFFADRLAYRPMK